jgi:hypothetical protein
MAQRVLVPPGRGRTASSPGGRRTPRRRLEDQSSPRHPVRLVSEAQGREPLWCVASDHGSVRRPPELGIEHPVDLTNEVLVRLLWLLPSPNVLQRT